MIITTNAVEKSTYVITATFTDEDGNPAVPNAGLTWRLTDESGTVINSRSAVAIASAASVTVVLSGNDLAITDPDQTRRVFTIQGTYNSTLGNNLPLKDEAQFDITNLIGVS